jgi:hypothetical protein
MPAALVRISIPKSAILGYSTTDPRPLTAHQLLSPILAFRLQKLEITLHDDAISLYARNFNMARHLNPWRKILLTACEQVCTLFCPPSTLPLSTSATSMVPLMNIQPQSISFEWSRADAFPVNSAMH